MKKVEKISITEWDNFSQVISTPLINLDENGEKSEKNYYLLYDVMPIYSFRLINFSGYTFITIINLVENLENEYEEIFEYISKKNINYIQVLGCQLNLINNLENSRFKKALHLREHILIGKTFEDIITYIYWEEDFL